MAEEGQPGTDCSDVIQVSISHATEITWNNEGKCVVSACEDGWQPNRDGNNCVDADVYYTVVICWTDSESTNLPTNYFCSASFRDNNKCFPVCGQNENSSTPISNILKGLFGSEETYCVPKMNYGMFKATDKTIDQLSVINKETQAQLRFTNTDKVSKLKEQFYLASDRIPENSGLSKPCDGYSVNIDAIILKHQNNQITIEHLVRIDD